MCVAARIEVGRPPSEPFCGDAASILHAKKGDNFTKLPLGWDVASLLSEVMLNTVFLCFLGNIAFFL